MTCFRTMGWTGVLVMTLLVAPAMAGEHETLREEIEAFQEQSAANLPEEMRELFAQGIVDVAALGVHEQALQKGDAAPDFTLPGATGAEVPLSGLLAEGPVVITFYRGGWCPYCNIQLRAMQRLLPAFEAAGATLVAISPELPDHSLDTAQKEGLAFEVLSDEGNAVARKFGVVYPLPDYLVDIFRAGLDLEARHGDDKWELPLAATYVIGQDGTISYAFLDADYGKRAEPSEVLEAVKRLAADTAR